jgi:PAS domain S-box-containing protein
MSAEEPSCLPFGGMKARIPADDADRLSVLRSFGALDSAPRPKFDELARLAAEICEVPMAFVSLVDEEREFFLAAVGSDLTESPRDSSFCGHTILQEGPFVVSDALDDPRFAENPNVIDGLRVRFYAGVPLVSREGYALGALCVKDTVPRSLTGSQLDALRVLGNQVAAQLELERQLTKSLANERMLRANRTLYRTLVERSPDLVSLIELDGTIRFVSQSYERLLGYTPEELVGGSIGVLVDPVQLERAFELVSRALAGEEAMPPRIRVRRKDGSLLTVETTIAILEAEDGDEPLVLATGRDLTARVTLEGQYREAERMETIGQLTGSIAHDFNNLLVPMLAYAGLALVQIREDQPKLRSQIEQIQTAAEQARELIRQLHAASRPQPSEPQPLSLNEIVETALPLVRMLLGPQIEVDHTPTPTLPLCTAEPGRLNQVILNLAANARDALPAEGGRVAITTGRRTVRAAALESTGLKPGEYVTLAFADNGSGIDAATKPRIFEPFFTTKDERGTGLGLATVQRIVGESGGAIDVESAPAQGSTFTISLPVSADDR